MKNLNPKQVDWNEFWKDHSKVINVKAKVEKIRAELKTKANKVEI